MRQLFNEVLGKEVSIPEAPERIVSFSPAATETLFEIGLGDRIVGVSAFCARPAEAQSRRRLGSYSTVRDELLDGLRPDLILTVTGYQREFASRLSRKYPVYPLELPATVAGIIDFVIKVGLVGGAPERGRVLARNLLRTAGHLGSVSALKSYVEIDLGGPVTFGAYSYITDAFRLLGSSHLYCFAPSEWLAPDLKLVAREDPEVVFYEAKMYSSFDESSLEKLFFSRGWDKMKAMEHGNVFLTPGPLDFLAHHGPSFISEALPWLEGRLRMAKDRVDS